MLEIDGSTGEAGGQILRTALALSCLLQKPFRIFNVRKGRKKPGLMPQHLTCVRASRTIADAVVSGDAEGSTELTFMPSATKPGDYLFDIGTAGSTSLLLQAILPSLVFSESGSRVTLIGGTHVPYSPPFHYINEIFVAMLGRLGISLDISIERYGFYPKGGGRATVVISPSQKIRGIELLERGAAMTITGMSAVGSLPVSIAERQRNAAVRILSAHNLEGEIGLSSVEAFSPGTFVFLKAVSDASVAGFSSLGERGKKAETVGEEAARELTDYYYSGACLDHHLADQIVLYLALAGEESSFTTSRITGHLLTNLAVVQKFTGMNYSLTGEKGKPGKVVITPSPF